MLLGGLLFGSCVVFMTFVLLNLLLSVILVAFNLELKHHQVTPTDHHAYHHNQLCGLGFYIGVIQKENDILTMQSVQLFCSASAHSATQSERSWQKQLLDVACVLVHVGLIEICPFTTNEPILMC